jgi:hypothetical protein
MKWRQRRRWISAVSLLVALVIVGGWPQVTHPAHAATGDLILNPTSGPPGTTITITPDSGTVATSSDPQGTTIQAFYISLCDPTATPHAGSQGQIGPNGTIPTLTITILASEQTCATPLVYVFLTDTPSNPLNTLAGVNLETFTLTGGSAGNGTPSPTPVPGAATLSVTPSGGVATGSNFTLSGSNFPSNTAVTLVLTGNGLTQALTPSPTTDGSGAFSSSFVAPTTAGTYTLIATAGSIAAQTTLVVGQGFSTTTVTATPQTGTRLTITPALVIPGQSVNVSGTGFAPSSQVTLTSSSSAITTSTANTDAGGAFSTSIGVPSGATGSVITITASDNSGHSGVGYISLNNGQSATLAASPNSAMPGQSLSVTGTNFAAGEQVTLGLALASSPTSFVNGTTQPVTVDTSRNLNATYIVPSVAGGSYLLVAIGQGSNLSASAPVTIQSTGTASPSAIATGAIVPFPTETPGSPIPFTATPTATATHTPPSATATPPPVPMETTYFAEGYTGLAASNGRANFVESLYLFNTTNAATNASVTYYIVGASNGTTRTVLRSIHLAAYGTSALSVNADAGADHLVSIAVAHAQGVVARVIVQRSTAGGGKLDAASSVGSTQAATTWSFAEGYTGVTFQEYLSIFNPGGTVAHVQIHYLPTSGPPPAPLSVTVPAGGRMSPNVGGLYLLRANPHAPKSIALIVTSDQPIVADRTLYWGVGAGSGKYGYDIVPGTPGGATSAVFASLADEGTNQPYITLLNPNSARVNLQIVFRDASGHVLVSYTSAVAPLARLTVSLRSVMPKYTGVVSASLIATAPVVAEAPLYFSGSPNVGMHPGLSLSGTAPSTTAALAGTDSSNATLYIYNPGSSTLHVTGLVGTASGSAGQGSLTVPPLNVLSASLPPGTGPRGLLLSASSPFVAELINGASTPAAWGSTLLAPH